MKIKNKIARADPTSEARADPTSEARADPTSKARADPTSEARADPTTSKASCNPDNCVYKLVSVFKFLSEDYQERSQRRSV